MLLLDYQCMVDNAKGGNALCLLGLHEVGRQMQAIKMQQSKSKHSVECRGSMRLHVDYITIMTLFQLELLCLSQ